MPTNHGFLREDEMVYHLDKRKVKDLSNNLYHMMQELYGVLDEEEVITCYKTDDFIKPDFVIIYKDETRYVSMKSGRSEIVHSECIKDFVLFLRSLGVSRETQKTVLYYHYGDGTLDGTGKERYDYDKLRYLLHDRIAKANEEFHNIDIIMSVIERCVFTGTRSNAIPIDALYHGYFEFGTVATKKQIIKHLKRKKWDYIQNLHIGPLQLRPHARYVGTTIKNERKRQTLECYWTNLLSDIDYISKRYDH